MDEEGSTEVDDERVSLLARRLEQFVKKMKCSGATGVGIENFKDIKVGINPEDVHVTSTLDTIDERDIEAGGGEEITVSLQSCTITGAFRNGSRHGHCEITFREGKVDQISGEYCMGKLNGKVKVKFRDKTLLVGYFKAGVLHGFARYFDSAGRLKFLGDHSNGVARGVCWEIIQGGGCVVGPVDSEGRHTGPQIMYLYPDFRTGFQGSFREGQFLSGHEAYLVDCYTDSAGIIVPVLRPRPRELLHTRMVGTFGQASDPQVRLRDPYESRCVYVAQSRLPGAAEGLFARRSIEINTVVAFYNGEQVRPDEYQSDSWEDNSYKIYDPSDYPEGTIDIPRWAQVSSAYSATLAHKTNHSFRPNSEFVEFRHPKYGMIPCLQTIRDIQEDQEIFVSYGYEVSESPQWFQDQWEEFQSQSSQSSPSQELIEF